MASTGLIAGINPYRSGNIAVDFTSKPTNLFIQLQQKEAAKREALDKYFMDYEKSLNPAGMRSQDQDVFLNKLGQAKQYYLQNRDKILNPAKYGAEFQSTYNATLRDAQNLIGQSKQAYGEDKAFKTYIDQLHKSGKAVDENQVFDMLNRSKKAIGLGYEAPDATTIESWTPHNPMALLSKINTLKRTEGAAVPTFLEGSKVKYQDVSPLTVDQGQLMTLANGELQDTGYRKYIEHIASQPSEVERLNKIYTLPDKKSPDYLSALSYANILSQAPKDEKRSNVKLTTAEQIRIALAKQKPNTQKTIGGGENQGNLFDSILDMNFKSGKIENGTALDNSGNPYNGTIYVYKENLPAEIFSAVGPTASHVKGFNVTFENGTPVKFVNPKTGTITRQGMENYQLKYNTEPMKGRQPQYGKGNGFKGVPKGGFN